MQLMRPVARNKCYVSFVLLTGIVRDSSSSANGTSLVILMREAQYVMQHVRGWMSTCVFGANVCVWGRGGRRMSVCVVCVCGR